MEYEIFFGCFKFNLTILKIWGLYPITAKPLRNYYIPYKYLMIFLSHLIIVLQLVNVMNIWSNVSFLAESSFILINLLGFIVKIIYFGKINNLKQMIEAMCNEKFQTTDKIKLEFLQEAATKSKQISTRIITGCICCIMFFSIHPLFSRDGKVLPFEIWVPFDKYQWPIFQILYIYQIVIMILSATAKLTYDTILIGMLCFGCAQLKILKYNLENLPSTYGKMHTFTQNNGNAYIAFNPEKELHSKIVECIELHKAIEEFLMQVQTQFSRSVFIQFFINVVVLCITAIELIMLNPLSYKFLSVCIYLCIILVHIFVICWYGNEVLSESSDLGQAIYLSKWYEENKSTRKTYFIMMERFKRPIELKAIGFFPISLQTFLAIVQTSYSYFTVLQSLAISEKDK